MGTKFYLEILSLLLICVSMVTCRNSQRAGPECRLPVETGTCSGEEERFYYDAMTGRCENFTYTGCGGNLNNFLTLSECNQRCLCSLPRRKGSCNLTFQRFYYNQDSGKCEKFKFSGCGGNPNNFASKTECEQLCEVQEREPFACQERPEVGSCGSKVTRYYYDANCQCCRDFIWSGCTGENGNNFARKNQCEKFCGSSPLPSTTTPEPDITVTTAPTTTTTQVTSSTTTTTTQTSTTTSTTQTTTTTTNATTSSTTQAPSTTTTERIPDSVTCLLQPDKGPCTNNYFRYYYDTGCDCCRVFKYGGCGGNENNFVRYRDCVKRCDTQ